MKKTLLSLATALTLLVSVVACKNVSEPYINPEVAFVETTITPAVANVAANSATITFALGDADAMFYPVCEAEADVNPEAAISSVKSFVAEYASSKGLTQAQALKKVLYAGTSNVTFSELENSTDYVAYAIQADLNGNFAYIASSQVDFTTEAEAQAAPIEGNYTGIYDPGTSYEGPNTITLAAMEDQGMYRLSNLFPTLNYNSFDNYCTASFDEVAMTVTADQVFCNGNEIGYLRIFIKISEESGLAFLGGDSGDEPWTFEVGDNYQLTQPLVDMFMGQYSLEDGSFEGVYEILPAGTELVYEGPASTISKVIDTQFGKAKFIPASECPQFAGLKADIPSKELPRL